MRFLSWSLPFAHTRSARVTRTRSRCGLRARACHFRTRLFTRCTRLPAFYFIYAAHAALAGSLDCRLVAPYDFCAARTTPPHRVAVPARIAFTLPVPRYVGFPPLLHGCYVAVARIGCARAAHVASLALRLRVYCVCVAVLSRLLRSRSHMVPPPHLGYVLVFTPFALRLRYVAFTVARLRTRLLRFSLTLSFTFTRVWLRLPHILHTALCHTAARAVTFAYGSSLCVLFTRVRGLRAFAVLRSRFTAFAWFTTRSLGGCATFYTYIATPLPRGYTRLHARCAAFGYTAARSRLRRTDCARICLHTAIPHARLPRLRYCSLHLWFTRSAVRLRARACPHALLRDSADCCCRADPLVLRVTFTDHLLIARTRTHPTRCCRGCVATHTSSPRFAVVRVTVCAFVHCRTRTLHCHRIAHALRCTRCRLRCDLRAHFGYWSLPHCVDCI